MTAPNFRVVIPVRLGSIRLPGKALQDICGKPLIQRVYECALQSSASEITIATDDPMISSVVESFGATVCMTNSEHTCGTDRIAETTEILGLSDDQIIVNLQGDEPRMPGQLIDQVATTLQDNPEASMATACRPLEGPEDYRNSNVVKVVRDNKNFALYFSRGPIPFSQEPAGTQLSAANLSVIRRHVGIYAYRVCFLKRFAKQNTAPLEQFEELEQLRILWNRESIAVCDAVELPGPGVDTLSDLESTIRYFS